MFIQQGRIYFRYLGDTSTKLMEVISLWKCSICDDEQLEGIFIRTVFICTGCEHNMIHTEPREEKYQYYVQKLKNRSDLSTPFY